MLEYKTLNHMELVEESEPKITSCMPHRGVYCPDKSSTRLTILFNASFHTISNLLLNEGKNPPTKIIQHYATILETSMCL